MLNEITEFLVTQFKGFYFEMYYGIQHWFDPDRGSNVLPMNGITQHRKEIVYLMIRRGNSGLESQQQEVKIIIYLGIRVIY